MSMLEPLEWVMVVLGAFCVGMGKAGLKGIDMLAIIIMAWLFGGKSSTGIVLPLLCLGDVAAVKFYNRHTQWAHIWKLLPWMIVGILLGVYLGMDMNESLFRQIMIITILITLIIIFWMEFIHKNVIIPTFKGFAPITGLVAGFTTMIGNMAGAFANLYFLAMRLPKQDFIGTTAWIFLVINLFKLPFQIFYWKNITWETANIDLLLIPFLGIGFYTGSILIRKINEQQFKLMIIWLTILGSLLMVFKK
jgi:uncharacterized membrane protein YfcA